MAAVSHGRNQEMLQIRDLPLRETIYYCHSTFCLPQLGSCILVISIDRILKRHREQRAGDRWRKAAVFKGIE